MFALTKNKTKNNENLFSKNRNLKKSLYIFKYFFVEKIFDLYCDLIYFAVTLLNVAEKRAKITKK